MEARLAALREEVAETSENDNVLKKNQNEQFVQINENPYEALNFPESMSYDKRSVLRKECYRFIKFAYYIDFLATDTLIKIYVNTLELFIAEVNEISDVQEPVVLRELEKQKQIGTKDALFKISLHFDLNYQDLDGLRVLEEQSGDFKYPKVQEEELKPSDFKNYNLLAHPFVVTCAPDEEFNVQKKKQLEYGDNQVFILRRVDNIEKVCLSLRPNLAGFQENLEKIIVRGHYCLKNFFSLARHQEMKKYYAVLEEWEEQDDSQEANTDETELKPMDCIDSEMKLQLESKLKALFQQEFEKTESFLSNFAQYLQVDWEYSKINTEVLTHKGLAKPGPTFNSIFNLLAFHKQLFEFKVPFQSDLGLFRLDSRGFKTTLMEKPAQVE